jgi:hypothetical protein
MGLGEECLEYFLGPFLCAYGVFKAGREKGKERKE